MARTIYFSKVSLDSQEVYEIVDNNAFRYSIVNNILAMLGKNYEYTEDYEYVDDEGEKHNGNVKYVLNVTNKDEESICGTIDRTASVLIKKRDELTGEMECRPVQNTDDIEFYYDVLHEYVAFLTRQRFKKNMFNESMGKILTMAAKENGMTYSFYLESFNDGMTIKEIQEQIKEDKSIKELTITYRPANPDEGMVEMAQAASRSELIRESNATERSIIYRAKGKRTIDGGASIIQEDLRRLEELNRNIPIEEMTQRGYAVVKSVNEKGDVKSTTDSKAFVRKLKFGDSFITEAKRGIVQILKKVNGV